MSRAFAPHPRPGPSRTASPDRPEFREHTFLILRRLRDYAARAGQLGDSPWPMGGVADFLELTPEQAAVVDIRVALARELAKQRRRHDWTQLDLALETRLESLQGCEDGVAGCVGPVDLYLRSLLALGVSRTELGALIASRPATKCPGDMGGSTGRPRAP